MEAKIGSCFLGWSLELTNGNIVVGVTLDVGPRIIKLQKTDGENIMFEDVGDNVSKDVSEVYGEGKKWHIYGGHRIWLSPESLATYYPDNAPVVSELKPDGAIFTPPAWTERGVQPVLELTFTPDGALEVKMRVKNISSAPQTLIVWALTVMKCGGTLTLPLSTEDTGYLANRNIVLWHYTDINDPRLTIANDRIILTGSTEAEKPLKIGTYLDNIRAYYRYGDTLFTKECTALPGAYPDFTSNFETYTSDLIHECETLSPAVTVAPGEEIVHIEKWRLE